MGAQRRRWAPLLLTMVGAMVLSGCAGGILEDGRTKALRIASEAGFSPAKVDAGPFVLYSYTKGRRGAGKRLVVYIEGDGRSWKSRYVPPADPTPANPVGLELAIRDNAPLVVYLARPCQYTRDLDRRACHPRYWVTHRFAEQVVEATDRAIDHYKTVLDPAEIELIGYSGGGAVAALVAARRNDVVALTTVAAPLDHEAWTAHHDVSALSGSLNPADYADRLMTIPQLHFVGGDDSIVPAQIVRAYSAKLAGADRVRIVPVEGHDHDCCWAKSWPKLRRDFTPE